MSVSFLDVFNQAIDRYPPIVPPQTLLAQAIAALHSEETRLDHYLLVTALGDKNSSLVGVLTEKEAVSFMAKHRDWFERPISEAMGEAIAYQVSEIASFQGLLSLFRQHRLPVLPLIDNEGIITGTITREQIWQAMEAHHPSCGDRLFTEMPLLRSEEQLHQFKENLEATVVIQEGNTREELKQQKEFLQAIFDSIPVILILFDREGQPQWVNRAWEQVIGWSLKELGDRDILAECYPDAEVYQQFRAWIGTENRKWQDFKTRVRDGVDLDISWASVELSDGATIAIGQDISDRKCAAAQLQAIQERFEYLIASSPAIIYSCSTDNKNFLTTFVSENIKEILGYSARDWLHDPNFWLDRLHPEDSSYIATNIELLFSLGHHIHEYRFLHQDGNYRWLRDEVKLIRDEEGNPIECIGSIIEIDDRKKTEAELRKSEERYRAIVQDQTELICRYRVDGTLIFVNDAYCRYFQQSRQDIIDRQWLPDILPEDLEKLNQQYLLLCPENPVYTCEIRTLFPNGTIRVQQWIDRGFFNTQGELIEIQAVGRDISDRKQAENDIRHALEKEKELSELKSNFISIASHEFRTPLTVIMASAKLQKHYSHKLSEEQKQQQLDRLLRASDRILRLLDDILILGRAEAGKIELSPASLNLKDFCLELLAEIEAIDENQHSIIFRNGESVDRNIIADENLLRYILTNLLSNATKYSPQNTPVMFNVAIDTCEVIFQVKDRGLGIPSEDIPHLFESFHRAKNVGEIKGTGLGLAIVKRAVELYEGAIDMESKINEGTTFTVTLPLLKEN